MSNHQILLPGNTPPLAPRTRIELPGSNFPSQRRRLRAFLRQVKLLDRMELYGFVNVAPKRRIPVPAKRNIGHGGVFFALLKIRDPLFGDDGRIPHWHIDLRAS